MKNLSLGINVILIVAVAILYYMFFTTQNNSNIANNKVLIGDTLLEESMAESNTTAFINVDSLLINYFLYDTLEIQLLEKQKQLESQLNMKVMRFQREVEEFQKKAEMGSFLSQESAQRQQQELAQKEQNILILKDELTQKLAAETMIMNQQLLDSVVNFVKIYNRDKKFQYILNSASFIHANDANNITKEIVAGLNLRYNTKEK